MAEFSCRQTRRQSSKHTPHWPSPVPRSIRGAIGHGGCRRRAYRRINVSVSWTWAATLSGRAFSQGFGCSSTTISLPTAVRSAIRLARETPHSAAVLSTDRGGRKPPLSRPGYLSHQPLRGAWLCSGSKAEGLRRASTCAALCSDREKKMRKKIKMTEEGNDDAKDGRTQDLSRSAEATV